MGNMKIKLKIWRQANPETRGGFAAYTLEDISPDMSFLEMFDVLNETLIKKGEDAISFDNDCREGICGMCSLMINGVAHGPERTCTCQLHMRSFRDGDTITVEPWRARAFPVIKDLVVDRSAFDRIIQAGGYISVATGSAPEANSISVPKPDTEEAMNAAVCIGCGACVAACPNASATLFLSAKISHLALLPQGKVEAKERIVAMLEQHDREGFGSCSNHAECEAVCPKEISISHIVRMRREFWKSAIS